MRERLFSNPIIREQLEALTKLNYKSITNIGPKTLRQFLSETDPRKNSFVADWIRTPRYGITASTISAGRIVTHALDASLIHARKLTAPLVDYSEIFLRGKFPNLHAFILYNSNVDGAYGGIVNASHVYHSSIMANGIFLGHIHSSLDPDIPYNSQEKRLKLPNLQDTIQLTGNSIIIGSIEGENPVLLRQLNSPLVVHISKLASPIIIHNNDDRIAPLLRIDETTATATVHYTGPQPILVNPIDIELVSIEESITL